MEMWKCGKLGAANVEMWKCGNVEMWKANGYMSLINFYNYILEFLIKKSNIWDDLITYIVYFQRIIIFQ